MKLTYISTYPPRECGLASFNKSLINAVNANSYGKDYAGLEGSVIAIDDNDTGENQFFMATHSPFVINDFMENLKKDDFSIYVTGYRKDSGETVVRRLTDEELHEIYQYGIDLYLNLENFLFHEQ